MSALSDVLYILIAVFLILLNGFFVAAEFALVKVRVSQLEELVGKGSVVARLALWLGTRLDASLSACQLGITMASLGLGWVGEPAFKDLITRPLEYVGVTSSHLVEGIAFSIAFILITALHLVVGEQAPKIFAIRRPELLVMWCAIPLAAFYFLAYPLLMALNATTSLLLRRAGVDSASEHETPHTEKEIRALLSQAHVHGKLTRAEHRLLNAVFEFDDSICRHIMLPRNEVDFLDANHTIADCFAFVLQTKHTRYPVCEGSLDQTIGVLHIKDMLARTDDKSTPLREITRPSHLVPETMPISQLLRHFQTTHQLMALVVDEYGTVTGMVTLENVLERIVGSVEDEFDTEPPEIARKGKGKYIVRGRVLVEDINRRLNLALETDDADTLAGLLMTQAGRVLEVGDRVEVGGVAAEVLEVDGARATRIQLTMPEPAQEKSS